jgi:hypothetical protein
MADSSPSRNQRMRLDESSAEMEDPIRRRIEKAKQFYSAQNDANMKSSGMSQQGKDVLSGLASLLPGVSTIQSAKNAYDRAGQIPGMVGAVTKKIEDNYYTPEMRKMGIEPDPRFAALKSLSQDNERDFQNAKDFGGELAMSYGGKLLGAFGKGAKKTPGMSLDAPERRSGAAGKVIENLNIGTPQEQAEKASLLTDLMKKGAYEKYNIADADLGYVKGATKPLVGDSPDLLRKTRSYIKSGGIDPIDRIKGSPSQLEKEILSDINLTGKKAVIGGEDKDMLERMINQFLQTEQLENFGVKSSGGRSKL